MFGVLAVLGFFYCPFDFPCFLPKEVCCRHRVSRDLVLTYSNAHLCGCGCLSACMHANLFSFSAWVLFTDLFCFACQPHKIALILFLQDTIAKLSSWLEQCPLSPSSIATSRHTCLSTRSAPAYQSYVMSATSFQFCWRHAPITDCRTVTAQSEAACLH